MKRRALLAGALGLSGCAAFDRLPIRAPDAPYVPTKQEVVEQMLALARVTAKDVVYDLGCGDGRIVITAAREHGARGVGVEIDRELVRVATENARAAGVSHLTSFRLEDMFKTDVREASVVALYLLPELMERLKFNLRAQLRPGARIVANEFGMGGDWEPDRIVPIGTSRIMLWEIRRA